MPLSCITAFYNNFAASRTQNKPYIVYQSYLLYGPNLFGLDIKENCHITHLQELCLTRSCVLTE